MSIDTDRIIKGRPLVQPTAVGVGGSTVKVPLVRSGTLRRVIAKLVSGTGVNFTLTIYDKETTPGIDNVVLQYDTSGDTDPTLLDLNTEIVFQNEADENELYVKVAPNAGADNNFQIKLEAVEGTD